MPRAIHHLNCGSLCPAARRLVNGTGSMLARGRMVCHCLLVETERAGLVLVDSGFGALDVADPRRIPRMARLAMKPRLDRAETAVAQVEALGFTAADVRHVVLTHLDLDHAGGLPDFPNATVHVHAVEQRAALARASFHERSRYREVQWAHGPRWSLYEEAGDTLFGLEAVRPLDGLADEVALLPLFGHTRGHSGVAVRGADGRWLLHAGDAYFHHAELVDRKQCPVGLRIFQSLIQMDRALRHANADRLRALAAEQRADLSIFCAHDVVELERLQAAGAAPSARSAAR